MRLRVGTSGFSFPGWKGHFYPKGLPAGEMLRHYAERLPAVEINNTFHRLPRRSLLEGWRERVPDGFRFALKASRRITHFRRLKDAGSETGYLLETAAALGGRLGAFLFQLPPGFPKDVERLRSFLAILPPGTRAAFEFRHGSWRDDEVHEALRGEGHALCLADTAGAELEIVATASWGYLRLRRQDYTEDDLRAWAERVRAQDWDEAYVFFKHEEAGAGPRLAARFLELAGG